MPYGGIFPVKGHFWPLLDIMATSAAIYRLYTILHSSTCQQQWSPLVLPRTQVIELPHVMAVKGFVPPAIHFSL
jgi:hypothetical protein